MPDIQLANGRRIGLHQRCFVVAEIGQNHNGRMELARELIDRAAYLGVDAVKFCKRHLSSELTAEAAARPYPGRNSFGATYGAHRQALELSIEQYAELKQRAESLGLIFFATACDIPSANQLAALDLPLLKVASRDLDNIPLLEHLAQLQRPLVLSTGMAGWTEIETALQTIHRYHQQVVLLHCTSAYPTPLADVNLRAMPELAQRLQVLVGLSDHSCHRLVPAAALALGAVMIEKHFTLDRQLPGTDHACSLDLDGMAQLLTDLHDLETALGDGVPRLAVSARSAQQRLARVLVSAAPIPAGSRLERALVTLKSGGPGLSWHQLSRLLGRTARRAIPADTVLREADFE